MCSEGGIGALDVELIAAIAAMWALYSYFTQQSRRRNFCRLFRFRQRRIAAQPSTRPTVKRDIALHWHQDARTVQLKDALSKRRTRFPMATHCKKLTRSAMRSGAILHRGTLRVRVQSILGTVTVRLPQFRNTARAGPQDRAAPRRRRARRSTTTPPGSPPPYPPANSSAAGRPIRRCRSAA